MNETTDLAALVTRATQAIVAANNAIITLKAQILPAQPLPTATQSEALETVLEQLESQLETINPEN